MSATALTESRSKRVNSSLLTVLVAFLANLLIAVAKSVAAVITSSASMVAEAAHSWADAGNEIFLLIADRRSDRGPDSRHPMGFGREAYVWSMFAAFGLFTAGAVVSIWHGIPQLTEPAEASNFFVAYIVLAIAFVLEGTSFIQATFQARRLAAVQGRSVPSFVLNTSNPTLRAVFAEDAAALVGCTWSLQSTWLVTTWSTAWRCGYGALSASWRSRSTSRRLCSHLLRPTRCPSRPSRCLVSWRRTLVFNLSGCRRLLSRCRRSGSTRPWVGWRRACAAKAKQDRYRSSTDGLPRSAE